MQNIFGLRWLKIGACMAFAFCLSGCGGGGCGATTALGAVASSACSNNEATNTLKKYEGVYSTCVENVKVQIELAAQGSNSLNYLTKAFVYADANCTGDVLGTFAWDRPATINHTGSATQTLPAVTIFPTADTVDTVTIQFKSLTASLTGSGVDGNCVKHNVLNSNISQSGEFCFDLSLPDRTLNGALYLSADGQYLLTFSLNDGTLTAESILSRSDSFNQNMLVSD